MSVQYHCKRRLSFVPEDAKPVLVASESSWELRDDTVPYMKARAHVYMYVKGEVVPQHAMHGA
jgi:hypothetical protein